MTAVELSTVSIEDFATVARDMPSIASIIAPRHISIEQSGEMFVMAAIGLATQYSAQWLEAYRTAVLRGQRTEATFQSGTQLGSPSMLFSGLTNPSISSVIVDSM